MALLVGDVLVDPGDATYAGSGLVLALFEARRPAIDAGIAARVATMTTMAADAQTRLDEAQAKLDGIEAAPEQYGDGYADIHEAAEGARDTAQDQVDQMTAQTDVVQLKVEAYNGCVDSLHELADPLIAYLVANVVVTVTIPASGAGAGLQRTPNPNTVDTATQAPAAPKTIAGVIT